jgi:hypothetical protein
MVPEAAARGKGGEPMSPSENPRTASELCDWLQTNRRVVSEAIRQLPHDVLRSTRASWKLILDRLGTGPEDVETFDHDFESLLDTLLDLPGVGRLLPGGFNGYLMPGGRQPTRLAAYEIYRKFQATLRVLNEDIGAEDEEAKAVPPVAPPVEDPRMRAERSSPEEARP